MALEYVGDDEGDLGDRVLLGEVVTSEADHLFAHECDERHPRHVVEIHCPFEIALGKLSDRTEKTQVTALTRK